MDKILKITNQRKTSLEEELRFLKTVRTREMEQIIAEALTYGDLDQNLEYDAARCEQQKMYNRIAEIEKILSCAVVTNPEEKRLTEAFLTELKTALCACGLTAKQAEQYAAYCYINYELLEEEPYGVLPADDNLETLKEAQRILLKNPGLPDLGDYTIHRYLQIPCDRWKSAKNTIMECFSCGAEAVDAFYNEDPECLLLTADDVRESAEYLKAALSDIDLCWKVFRKGAVYGGTERFRSRTDAFLEMLGTEIGLKVIRTDAAASGWIYRGYYSDPVACLAYMLECGLTPEKILALIEKDPDFLYSYKIERKRSYCHDQEYIDKVIQRYK